MKCDCHFWSHRGRVHRPWEHCLEGASTWGVGQGRWEPYDQMRGACRAALEAWPGLSVCLEVGTQSLLQNQWDR